MDCQTLSGSPPAACQGKFPETLFKEMEAGMKMISFIFGTMVGGMLGVAMMCLLQINRLHKHDWEVDE